jgi:predicted GNAT family acetyltransferase
LQEEVALPAQKIGEKDAAIFLRDILQNQLVFALFCDDEPVAKANTRAIGFNWIQIGGIYTLPLFRKNGFAHRPLFFRAALARNAFGAGRAKRALSQNAKIRI